MSAPGPLRFLGFLLVGLAALIPLVGLFLIVTTLTSPYPTGSASPAPTVSAASPLASTFQPSLAPAVSPAPSAGPLADPLARLLMARYHRSPAGGLDGFLDLTVRLSDGSLTEAGSVDLGPLMAGRSLDPKGIAASSDGHYLLVRLTPLVAKSGPAAALVDLAGPGRQPTLVKGDLTLGPTDQLARAEAGVISIWSSPANLSLLPDVVIPVPAGFTPSRDGRGFLVFPVAGSGVFAQNAQGVIFLLTSGGSQPGIGLPAYSPRGVEAPADPTGQTASLTCLDPDHCSSLALAIPGNSGLRFPVQAARGSLAWASDSVGGLLLVESAGAGALRLSRLAGRERSALAITTDCLVNCYQNPELAGQGLTGLLVGLGPDSTLAVSPTGFPGALISGTVIRGLADGVVIPGPAALTPRAPGPLHPPAGSLLVAQNHSGPDGHPDGRVDLVAINPTNGGVTPLTTLSLPVSILSSLTGEWQLSPEGGLLAIATSDGNSLVSDLTLPGASPKVLPGRLILGANDLTLALTPDGGVALYGQKGKRDLTSPPEPISLPVGVLIRGTTIDGLLVGEQAVPSDWASLATTTPVLIDLSGTVSPLTSPVPVLPAELGRAYGSGGEFASGGCDPAALGSGTLCAPLVITALDGNVHSIDTPPLALLGWSPDGQDLLAWAADGPTHQVLVSIQADSVISIGRSFDASLTGGTDLRSEVVAIYDQPSGYLLVEQVIGPDSLDHLVGLRFAGGTAPLRTFSISGVPISWIP